VRVSNNFARIVTRAETLSNQVIETEPLWTSDFNNAVQGRTDGGPRDPLGDIISGYGLNQHWGQSNRCSVSGFVTSSSRMAASSAARLRCLATRAQSVRRTPADWHEELQRVRASTTFMILGNRHRPTRQPVHVDVHKATERGRCYQRPRRQSCTTHPFAPTPFAIG